MLSWYVLGTLSISPTDGRRTLVERGASTEAEPKQVLAGLKPGEVDASIVASPHLQTNHPKLIIKLGEDARLPVVEHREASVDRKLPRLTDTREVELSGIVTLGGSDEEVAVQ